MTHIAGYPIGALAAAFMAIGAVMLGMTLGGVMHGIYSERGMSKAILIATIIIPLTSGCASTCIGLGLNTAWARQRSATDMSMHASEDRAPAEAERDDAAAR